jgi:perosamine synthetase
MCCTNDPGLVEKMKILRDHGMSKSKRYWHEEVGFNYRMTNLQASIGLAQVERIDQILERRRSIETMYRTLLKDTRAIRFQPDDLVNRKKITWLVCGLLENRTRDTLIEKGRKEGIDIRPFFYPLSEMEIYRKYLFSNKNSINISQKGINFPTNNSVTEELIKSIRKLLSEL